MNQYKEKFNKKKNELVEVLNETKGFYEKYKLEKNVAIFDEILKNVNEGEFSIVLVGEFSAGKSTFLNALMGARLLPSFTNETTATINYLRHKNKAKNGEAGVVYFKDGTTKILDKVDFKIVSDYVSTESEIGVVRAVDHLDLFLDSKFLEGNITLVDSPGLNGIADFHRDVTENQIEKSNASIFMFKANQPGSETDFKFLEQLKNRVNTIIFGLNKIDDIKNSEGETVEYVIEKLKESYRKKFPNDIEVPEIWGISAYQALVARSNELLDYRGRNNYSFEEKEILEKSSRMKEFENRLWKFITEGEKARAMLTSPIDKVIANLKDNKKNIDEEKLVLNNKIDSSEIEEEIIKVKNQIDGIEEEIKSINNKIIKDVNLCITEINENFENKIEKLKDNTISKLDNWNDIDELVELERGLILKTEKEYKKIVRKCESNFTEKIREIILENYENIAGNINLNLQDSKFNIQINSKFENREVDMKIGINKYEEEIERLEEELKKSEMKSLDAEGNALKARVIEKEKENLEMKIQRKEKEKIEYSNMISIMKEYETREVIKTRKRAGVWGKFKNFFDGGKEYQTQERIVVNQDEIEENKKVKKAIESEHNLVIESLNKELESKRNYISEDEAELINRKLQRETEILREKILEKQKEFKEQYMKRNKVALRNRKYELEDYFSELNDEYLEALKKELTTGKEIYINVIRDNIAQVLNKQLENRKKQCELLENKLNSSMDEKNNQLKNLEEMEEDLRVLMEKSVRIKMSIEL